ncbi:hypothetical protein [Microbacterium sp. ZOR0019]|uniref:hypothetical protein n=1 Tax=Microbacterium sp. ZOR0019 TaxID=1339233 RepID=UPI000648A2A8|nr:hypothetical protein [Microbacterium sp. ZOR0019]
MTNDNDIIRESIRAAERFSEIFERHIEAVSAYVARRVGPEVLFLHAWGDLTYEQIAAVLGYETDDARFRLTVNPEAGAIVKIEKFLLRALPELWNRHTKDDPLVDVGSAPFLPANVPDFSASFTSLPLG